MGLGLFVTEENTIIERGNYNNSSSILGKLGFGPRPTLYVIENEIFPEEISSGLLFLYNKSNQIIKKEFINIYSEQDVKKLEGKRYTAVYHVRDNSFHVAKDLSKDDMIRLLDRRYKFLCGLDEDWKVLSEQDANMLIELYFAIKEKKS